MELMQTKEGIMSIMIITAAVAIAAIAAIVASAIVVSRDGYRRVPTRQA